MQQNVDVCRGAVLALGFMVGRILYHENSSRIAAATDNDGSVRAAVEKMDVDNATSVYSSDSAALYAVLCSAVSRLGEYCTNALTHFYVGLYRIADFTIRSNKNNSFYYLAEYE